MKKILRNITIILLATTMYLSLIHFRQVRGNPSTYDLQIFVDDSIEPRIRAQLEQYMANIQNEGWSYLNNTLNVTEWTPMELRSQLEQRWINYNISGCLFVGDFQSAEWVNGTSYYTDYYYMDLNGTWTDADDPPEGKRFNNHNGHIRPEIWVGRLMASTIDDGVRNETEVFKDYFQKNNETRKPSSRVSHALPRALAYIDNVPAFDMKKHGTNESGQGYDPRYVNDTIECLEKAYTDVTLASSPIPNATNTNPDDYEYRLGSTDGYEWVWLYVHGGYDDGGDEGFHAFSNYIWIPINGSRGYWYEQRGGDGWTESDYYLHSCPKSFFHIFSSCHSHRFDLENSVSNAAIFGNGSGLASIAFGGIAFASWFSESFEGLKQHGCIGEAFKTMCNAQIDYYKNDPGWQEEYIWKNLVLLGDPTLFIDQPPYTPSQPSGRELGGQGLEYTYTTNTTDLGGDQVSYQFDWDDGTNTTVGPYDSGETGEASHAWPYPGMYSVRVRAKDNYTIWSDWSEPLNVTMTERIRYMQNATWDSTYWKLFWNNTITSTHKTISRFGWYLYGELGVKIYNGSVEISDGVVKVGRWYNTQSTLKNETWECAEHNVTSTYIRIEVYYKFSSDADWTNMNVAFRTKTFTENTTLNAANWTICLYGEFQMEWGPLGPGTPPGQNRAAITFCWGSSSEESRIEDMIFTYG